MGFIRPQSKAQIRRWREVLLGLGIFIWGIWLSVMAVGLFMWAGWALLVIGVVWIVAGVQRARFRVGAGGAGVVQVDEREVIYFGPIEGGSISIEALAKVELIPGKTGAHRWFLTEAGTGRAPLSIPVNADHADALFDAFGVLEGFEMQNMLAVLNAPLSGPVLIWQKRTGVLLTTERH
jgi:hypothetical protein